MVSGLVSFGLGAYCAWWPYRETRPPIGFAIGITFGGIAQVIAQRSGYNAIMAIQCIKIES
jgi:peptidoglycan biosynthesis protein MviN/MurJ (putative lipid II flippase)